MGTLIPVNINVVQPGCNRSFPGSLMLIGSNRS